MRYILFSICLLLSGILSAQKSQNVQQLGVWDDNSIPSHFFGTFNDIWGYATDDAEYIIMGSAAYIHIFDVTDPSNLIEVDRIEPGVSTVWRDFKTYQHYAYCVSDNSGEGLVILDLNPLPDSVALVNQDASVISSTHNIFIDEANGRLYAVGSNSGNIAIFDIATDPVNPIHLGSPSVAGGNIHDVYVRDNIAYCSSEFDGYFILDVTDTANPIEIANIPTNGYNHSSWVSDDGTYAIFAEEVPNGLPLGIMDLTGMMDNDIQVTTYFQELLEILPDTGEVLKNTPHNPFLIGDIAYVSYYEDGLHVYDLSTPAEPNLVAFYDSYPDNVGNYNGYAGCWGVYPFLPSGNVFISDMTYGLMALEVDLTTNTTEIDAFDNIKVFPNPASDYIHLQIDNNVSSEFEYQIFNTTAQLVSNNIVPLHGNEIKEIDISNLTNGIYFLSIINQEGTNTTKFIKE